MQRRNPERRGPSTAKLSALACLTALVVSTLMVFSSPANAGAKSPSGVAGGADKRCSKVDPKHPASDCPTGTAGGAMGAVDASSLAEQLLSQVAKTAGTKIGGQIAGINADQFNQCVDTKKTQAKIQAHLKIAEARQVSATPSFIFGDKQFAGFLSYDQFKQFVDQAVAKGGNAAPMSGGDTAKSTPLPTPTKKGP